MKKILFVLASIALLGLFLYLIAKDQRPDTPVDVDEQKILRLPDRTVVQFQEVLEDIKAVPLVFVGELHDQKRHHWAQLEVIRSLHNAGLKVAVGLEMFRAQEQDLLDRWVSGEIPEERFIPIYLRNWGSPWTLYANIFFYARENRIPMVGLNVPRQVTRKVARRGFSSLENDQLQNLPPVVCDVDPVYQEFIRRALGVPGKEGLAFQYFCEAQLVWDSAMAWYALHFLKENPNYTIVILAGSGHAWKRGIPEQIRRRSDLPFMVILPEVSRLDRANVTPEDTDYLWLNLPMEP